MWILKGSFLGLWLFGFGTIGLLYLSVYRHLPPNSSVAVGVITAHTTQNWFWWMALVVCLLAGGLIVRSWSAPLILWIALAVTGAIPAGLLALFITLVVHLNRISRLH